MRSQIVSRVVLRDQALFDRLRLPLSASRTRRTFWKAITHAGGVWSSVSAAVAPVLFDNPLRDGARRATVVLVASHLLVQLVKRTVSRPRPASAGAVIAAPDRFSFPSGHAAAAFSVALGFASAHPLLGAPLIALAGLVGASRIFLGVHYPADVFAGQAIALLTAAALAPVL